MARKQTTRQPAKRAEAGKPAKAIVSELLVNRLAERYGVPAGAFLDSLRNTIFKPGKDGKVFSDMEVAAALILAEQYDLNPFARELFVTRNKGHLLVIVPIDGWVKILNRQKDFDGVEFEFEDDEDGNLVACTAVIFMKNRAHPVRVPEYLDECQKDTEPWKKWPRRMLRHKALIQAARVAYGLTALDEDEAERLGYRVPDFTVTDAVKPLDAPKPARKARQAPVEVRAGRPPSGGEPDINVGPDAKEREEAAAEAKDPPGFQRTEVEKSADDRDDARGPVDNAEMTAFKNKLLDDIRQFARDLTTEEFDEVRAAAGGTMFNLECGVAELEAAIHKAEEIAGGKRE